MSDARNSTHLKNTRLIVFENNGTRNMGVNNLFHSLIRGKNKTKQNSETFKEESNNHFWLLICSYLLPIAYSKAFHDRFCNVYFCKVSALILFFNKSITNAKTSLKSGWDRDSQVKKGGMTGLTGNNGRESGI